MVNPLVVYSKRTPSCSAAARIWALSLLLCMRVRVCSGSFVRLYQWSHTLQKRAVPLACSALLNSTLRAYIWTCAISTWPLGVPLYAGAQRLFVGGGPHPMCPRQSRHLLYSSSQSWQIGAHCTCSYSPSRTDTAWSPFCYTALSVGYPPSHQPIVSTPQ